MSPPRPRHVWVALFWLLNAALCPARAAGNGTDDGMPPRVDVRFRAGARVDEPMRLLPPDLRASVTRASPLFTPRREELARMGAEKLARWFRLELVPGTDVSGFMARLSALDVVETVERAAVPAPPPNPKPDE